MELVYLWVEEYKNIKNQGFNFSPRFECSYDKDKKKLTICDKKKNECKNNDYIENFFGEKINVTAIVGENGSGKSSIFKSLIYLISSLYFKPKENNEGNINIANLPLKAFIVFNISDERKYISYNIDDNSIKLERLTDIRFYSIYYNYLLDSLTTNEPYDTFINSLYHKSDRYTTPILLEPSKSNNIMSINEYNYKNNNILFKQFTDDVKNEFIQTLFDPNQFEMIIDKRKIKDKVKDFINPTYGSPILHKKTYDDLGDKTYKQLTVKSNEEVLKDVDTLFENVDYEKINNIYFATKILMHKIDSTFRDELFNIVYYEKEIIDSLNKKIEKIEKRKILDELFTPDTYSFEKEKLEKSIIFEKEILHNKERLQSFNSLMSYKHGQRFNDINTIKPIKSFIPPWINIKFYEDDKCFDSLSSGEKQYITLMTNLNYQINNLKEVKNYDTVNLMLDEVELSLHPNWQKRFMHDLINLIKKYSKTINIIISSHSPFVLSDLPKENVIFLEKGKQVDVDINPFGANIHTLLSHGFFMKKGLMGEFAKNKINSIKEFYDKVIEHKANQTKIEEFKAEYIEQDENQKTLKDKFKDIHKIIGEPFLKTIIGNYLDELHIIFSDDKSLIEKELQEIEKRKKYLESLKR